MTAYIFAVYGFEPRLSEKALNERHETSAPMPPVEMRSEEKVVYISILAGSLDLARDESSTLSLLNNVTFSVNSAPRVDL